MIFSIFLYEMYRLGLFIIFHVSFEMMMMNRQIRSTFSRRLLSIVVDPLKPLVAGTTPIAVDVVEGKNYFWCTCGRSSKQPLCDGSHKDVVKLKPLKFTATKTETLFFCACKATANSPLCDGSHNALNK